MATSAIFHASAQLLRQSAPSAIFSDSVRSMRQSSQSAIFAGTADFNDIRIRNNQVAYRTLASDRLSSTPLSVLTSTTSFDLTQTRVYSMYITPQAKLGFILGVFAKAVAAENVTAEPQISVGITSGESDILAQETMSNFTTLGDVWSNWVATSKARSSKSQEIVKINVVGATADKLLADIYLVGFEY